MSDMLGIGQIKLVHEIVSRNWGVTPEMKKFSYSELLFVLQEMQRDEGREYFAERVGLRGFHIFREFVKMLLYRNLANYDSMLLVSSEKGSGKSSAALMLAKEWCRLLGRPFLPEKYFAYNNADLQNKLDTLPDFSPIVADESIRFASASDWNRRENKELKKKLAQIRTKHFLFILCFPLKVQKLDKVYLDSFVNYWLDLFGRGVGAIYVKDRNPVMDSWRLKEFGNVGSYTEFTPLNRIEKALRRHPNFWQIIKFPRPADALYKRYLSIRETNVYDDDAVLRNVTREDINNALLVLVLRDIMTDSATHTINRVILHIKNRYDVNLSKQGLQATIDDARQLVQKLREKALNYENTKTQLEVAKEEVHAEPEED